MTALTPERLAELDALIGRPLWGTTELVEMRKIAPALSAALRAAWAERDQWRTYAHDVEGVTQSIAEIMTGEPDTSGIVHRVKEIRAERDRLAARLAEAEELLRPFAKEVSTFSADRGADGWDGAPHECPLHLYSLCWNGNIGLTVGDCRAAAEFLARTEPAK